MRITEVLTFAYQLSFKFFKKIIKVYEWDKTSFHLKVIYMFLCKFSIHISYHSLLCYRASLGRKWGFNIWVQKCPCRRKWQPTPIFLPGKSPGQRSLAGCCSWGHRIGQDLATKQQQHGEFRSPVGKCGSPLLKTSDL